MTLSGIGWYSIAIRSRRATVAAFIALATHEPTMF